MGIKKIKLWIVAIVITILSCSQNNSSELKKDVEGKNKKVLIIGIDGCRPDGLIAATTPNLDRLMANGTFSLDARNTGITISGPSWSAMLTGVWENRHGVTDNSFSGANYARYPHFFKRIEEANPEYRTVSVSQWHPINDQMGAPLDKTVNTQDSTSDTKNRAISELRTEDLKALFLHFDDVDHAGHRSGFSPENPEYTGAIEIVDGAIGEVLMALKERPNYENEDWVILVSTDHGGIGTGHGGDTDEERTIFMIVSGDHVPKMEISKTTEEIVVLPVDNCLESSTDLYFDAKSVIEVPNDPAYNFGAAQDFSIECRIRTSNSGDVGILAKKDWDSGLLPGYVFSFNPNNGKFKVNMGDGNHRVDIETETISDNEWHTLSATFDRDGLAKVYIDGMLNNTADISVIGNMDNNLPFTIGADGHSEYNYQGYVSEVRIFNTLLDVSDINSWKCKVLNDNHPKYSNIKGYWKITEGQGDLDP